MSQLQQPSDLQRAKARSFAELHRSGCFVLPNAWDAASALLCREAGFEAVGTTSAGVALARGTADGERFGRERMLEVAGDIAARLPLPVSADLEAGYGRAPEAVAATVTAAIAAGLVGCNIEDSEPASGSLLEVELAAERIRAAAESARGAGLEDFVVNARVDCYLRGMAPDDAFPQAVERANRYLAAGASCAFVPGPSDAATAERLASAIDGPLNIMAGGFSATAPLADLAAAGVRRISLGGSLMAAAYGGALAVLRQIVDQGRFDYTKEAGPAYMTLARLIQTQEQPADA